MYDTGAELEEFDEDIAKLEQEVALQLSQFRKRLLDKSKERNNEKGDLMSICEYALNLDQRTKGSKRS